MASTPDKSLIDCYWFLQNKCNKGEACEYRHSESALNNFTVCKFWIEGKCTNQNCYFRHPSGVHTAEKKIPCTFFLQGNCIRGPKCPFLHEISSQIHEDEEKLRKLQEARQLEEKKLADLKARSEALKKQAEVKKPTAGATATRQKKGGKEEEGIKGGKREETMKGVNAKKGKGTFVKSFDEIIREKQRESHKATAGGGGIGGSRPATKVQPAQKAQPAAKAQPASKAQPTPAPAPAPSSKKREPKKNQKKSEPEKPSGPVNYGVKTLEQIMKEKEGNNSETTPVETPPKKITTTEKAALAGITKTPSEDKGYVQKLREKNQKKFSAPADQPSPQEESEKKRKVVEESEIASKKQKMASVGIDDEMSKIDAEIKELSEGLDIDELNEEANVDIDSDEMDELLQE